MADEAREAVVRMWQAMKALEEGKKVRCKDWEHHFYICLKADRWEMHLRESMPECLYGDTWELYDDQAKLDFKAVVEGLKQGKRFRRSSAWKGNPKRFIKLEKSITGWCPLLIDSDGDIFHANMEDFEAVDWECVD